MTRDPYLVVFFTVVSRASMSKNILALARFYLPVMNKLYNCRHEKGSDKYGTT